MMTGNKKRGRRGLLETIRDPGVEPRVFQIKLFIHQRANLIEGRKHLALAGQSVTGSDSENNEYKNKKPAFEEGHTPPSNVGRNRIVNSKYNDLSGPFAAGGRRIDVVLLHFAIQSRATDAQGFRGLC